MAREIVLLLLITQVTFHTDGKVCMNPVFIWHPSKSLEISYDFEGTDYLGYKDSGPPAEEDYGGEDQLSSQ